MNKIPMELAGYTVSDEVEKDDKNCGSVCGCNADKGVGCEGVNGENDQGSDCPKKQG